mmetsp:Transcript_557/g.1772  ORF Transcript_557/g.1772 Transcript_557/m.1772 type:complete len:365 (-) Transcript_557:144-1238(-)
MAGNAGNGSSTTAQRLPSYTVLGKCRLGNADAIADRCTNAPSGKARGSDKIIAGIRSMTDKYSQVAWLKSNTAARSPIIASTLTTSCRVSPAASKFSSSCLQHAKVASRTLRLPATADAVVHTRSPRRAVDGAVASVGSPQALIEISTRASSTRPALQADTTRESAAPAALSRDAAAAVRTSPKSSMSCSTTDAQAEFPAPKPTALSAAWMRPQTAVACARASPASGAAAADSHAMSPQRTAAELTAARSPRTPPARGSWGATRLGNVEAVTAISVLVAAHVPLGWCTDNAGSCETPAMKLRYSSRRAGNSAMLSTTMSTLTISCLDMPASAKCPSSALSVLRVCAAISPMGTKAPETQSVLPH